MREFIITEAKSEEAVLVGLITKNQNEEQAREYLDELDFLSSTAGVRAVRRFTQRLDQPHSVTSSARANWRKFASSSRRMRSVS